MYKKKKTDNNKNIIRAMLAGYLAAFVFVLFAFGIRNVPVESADEKAREESVSRAGFTYSRPQSSLKDIQSGDDNEDFEPAPDKLNLAYFFPDDADTSDSINSYAGKIYTSMNARNAEYFASYFDLTDSTPRSIASRYGLGADRVMGKYNPNDVSHSAQDSSTWTVNSFRNINVSFYDGDGNRISGYYNAQEIMALASVYAYYHEMDDYEAMLKYCEELFGASVSAKVSLGSVYYDSGCLNRTIEQEASEAIALEQAQSQIEGGSSVSTAQTTGNAGSEYATVRVPEGESYSHGYAMANGDLSQTRTAASGESYSDIYAEQSSAVIYDYTTAAAQSTASSSGKKSWQSMNDNVVVSPGSATTLAPTQVESTAAAINETPSETAAETTTAATAADVVVGAADTSFADNAESFFAGDSEETAAEYIDAADGVMIFMNGSAGSIYDNVVVSPAEGASGTAQTAETGSEAAAMSAGQGTVTNEAAQTDAANAAGNTQDAAAQTTTAQDIQQTTAAQTGTLSKAESLSQYTVQSPAQSVQQSGGNLNEQTSAQTQDTLAAGSGESADTGNAAAGGSDTVTVTSSYCPGHIDLYVSITIKGIDDSNSLFKADPIGNNKDNFNDEWQGWTEDKIALAKALCEQDWLENYGLSISSIKVSNSLTSEEINSYLDSLASDVSQTRRNIVEYALNSVGKVPYYWGGKPSGPGYTRNNFYSLVSPDYRGRILKGLDCSGWINWVYWSVMGQSLAGESTGTLIGCGRRIQRSELKPGDIIIRTGADAHVVMFLCWAQNGNFIGIHETGGVINNVVVSEMTASWPYYRALVE